MNKNVLLWLVCLMVWWPGAGGAREQVHVVPVADLAVAGWPGLAGLPPEVRAEGNGVLWRLVGRERHTVKSVVFEDPHTGNALPTRTEAVAPPRNCYALMIDDSLSMRPFWPAATAAMQTVLGLVPENEYVGLYRFSEDLIEVRPLMSTASLTDGAAAIGEIELVGRDTQIFMALIHAMDDLARCPGVRGHLIVFSDGDAEDIARTLPETTQRAREQGVAMHTVGFARAGQTGTSLAMEVLRSLSRDSQGLYHFYENPESLTQAMSGEFARHQAVGLALPQDLRTLEYGQDRLELVITTTDGANRERVFRVSAPITGTDTWDNWLVSLSARCYGLAPWQILAGPVAGLLLLLLLLLIVRRRGQQRRARLEVEREAQREQAEGRRLEELKQHVEQRDAQVHTVLEQVHRKLEEFQPEARVMDQGEAYGRLVDLNGPAYPLITCSTRIGRGPDNDVILPDDHISARHAILDFKHGRFIWTDRAPKNVTYVNDAPVQGSREIRPNDIILCGETRLRFELDLVGE